MTSLYELEMCSIYIVMKTTLTVTCFAAFAENFAKDLGKMKIGFHSFFFFFFEPATYLCDIF